MSLQKFYSPEHYVDRPEELYVTMRLAESHGREFNKELDDHAEAWFRLYYHGRKLDKRPPFDEDRCRLAGIEVIPYIVPDDSTPGLALIGLYDVELEPVEVDGRIEHPIALRADEPLLMHIDTHGGNFEYLSCGVAHDPSGRVMELSEEFSIHVARYMLAYYRSNGMSSSKNVM